MGRLLVAIVAVGCLWWAFGLVASLGFFLLAVLIRAD